jgi:PBP superfamily domain
MCLLSLALVLLAACQPAQPPVTPATPVILTVQATPALQLLAAQFHACAKEMGNTGVVLLDFSSQNQAALTLRWGAGSGIPDRTEPQGYAAVIGQEELAVVVNPRNPRESISLSDVQAIYSGALRAWPQTSPPGEIQPWTYPSGDDTQAVFDANILNNQPASARVVSLAPDPAAMREAVAGDPAAIGFLPRRWVDGTVKALAVEGIEPDRMRQPILAISKAEPQGMEKTWLICLQERLKKSG